MQSKAINLNDKAKQSKPNKIDHVSRNAINRHASTQLSRIYQSRQSNLYGIAKPHKMKHVKPKRNDSIKPSFAINQSTLNQFGDNLTKTGFSQAKPTTIY